MGTSINLKNVTIHGEGRLLNNATVAECNTIGIETLNINDKGVVLENLNISSFCRVAEMAAKEMSLREYESFQKLLKEREGDRESFLKHLGEHLTNFATGIIASMVANYFTK